MKYKRIWLQWNPDGDRPANAEYQEWDGITWCQDQINDDDVMYIRADLVARFVDGDADGAELGELLPDR